MKKFIRQLTIFSLIFIMTFGVGFSSQKGINVQAATTQTTTTNDGKLRKNGVLFTGISDNKYYKRGVFTKYTGWKNWKGNRYYLQKGKAVTGWKYLRDYSGSRTKYKYYFKKNQLIFTIFLKIQHNFSLLLLNIYQVICLDKELYPHNSFFYH